MPATMDAIYQIQDALRDEGDPVSVGVVQSAVEKIERGEWLSNAVELAVEHHYHRMKINLTPTDAKEIPNDSDRTAWQRPHHPTH